MTTREALLATPGIVLNQGTFSQSGSPTLSTSRVRWQSIQRWVTIQQDFETYWQSLNQEELGAVIEQTNYMANTRLSLLAMLPAPTTELELFHPFQVLYVYPHNFAASSVGAAHSHVQITVFAPQYALAGEPDYLFVYNGIVCGVIEMKTFWKVSRESIEEVLNGKRPVKTF